jgi:hypothetical protein
MKFTCAGGLSAPAARYIVHAPSLPGRNCTKLYLGSKDTRFWHGGETPVVIRPARRCRRTPITCRPDPPPLLALGRGMTPAKEARTGFDRKRRPRGKLCVTDQLETRKPPPPRKSLSSFFLAKPFRPSATVQQIASYHIYLSLCLFPPL